MDLLDIFAFVVIAVLILVVMVIIVGLGMLPGAIALKRGHPQASAVNVAGWIGIATLGILWPLALIWAFWKPPGSGAAVNQATTPISAPGGSNAQPGNMQARVKALEDALHNLQVAEEKRT